MSLSKAEAFSKTLVVIGGGAAGFFCAVNAARQHKNLKVFIVEKSGKVLSKVKVSGGGRCNVTHYGLSLSELVAKYPRGKNLLKKIFHQFAPEDTVQWFEHRNVPLKTEADGRMFPLSNSSQSVIDCLLKEAEQYHVDIRLNASVDKIVRSGDRFLICMRSETLSADYVCIACGGLSKKSQFGWLSDLGLEINDPVPSLFTFNIPQHGITKLMGLSVRNASVKIMHSKLQESGPLLITHWGLSGPAVLKLSAWGARMLAEKDYHFQILVNWLGDISEEKLRMQWPEIRRQNAARKMHGHNPFGLPNRLWDFFLRESGIPDAVLWGSLTSKVQNSLIKILTAHPFEVNGKTTFKEEFVTCGGISLSEIDANTMQSKKIPDLYFAGEIVDVDGITGGFNFQNAWTTGWIAAGLKSY